MNIILSEIYVNPHESDAKYVIIPNNRGGSTIGRVVAFKDKRFRYPRPFWLMRPLFDRGDGILYSSPLDAASAMYDLYVAHIL